MDDWDVMEEFSRRRIRQYAVTIPIFVAYMAWFLTTKSDRSSSGWSAPVVIGIVVVAIGMLVFSLWNWRCPACGGYLGRSIAPRYCQGCGAQLRQ